jgi:hypothetical protein
VAADAVDAGQPFVRADLDSPAWMLTWVYQLSSSSTVMLTRGSARRYSRRLRVSSMLTRIRSPSKTYHVATDTGCPSGRRAVITAGLGRSSSSTTSDGMGGFGIALTYPVTTR